MHAWSVRRKKVMPALRCTAVAAAALMAVLVGSTAEAAQTVERIGSAIQIVQTVTGEIEANFRYLILQDPVFQDEVIATKPGSASRIVFRDNTELQVGPEARITLDNFVFDPDPSVARFVISAFDGVFRFATGKLAKTAYQIETPTAVIGVRGTTFASIFGPSGEQVILLEEGVAVTVRDRSGGPVRTLSQPGLSVTIIADGFVTEPAPPPEWALEKLRELNALLVTLDVLIRGDDLDDDPPSTPPPAPLPPVQEAALPAAPPPVVEAPHIPAPKPAPEKADHKPYPKPEAKPRQRALRRADAVAAAPAHDHGLPRAKDRADIRAAGDTAHGNGRSDIRIERRGRRAREHIERDDGDDREYHADRLEPRPATPGGDGRDTPAPATARHDQQRAGDIAYSRDTRGRHERTGRSRSNREYQSVNTNRSGDRDRGNHDRGRSGGSQDNTSSHGDNDRGGRDQASRDRGDSGHDRGDRGRGGRRR